MQDIQVSGVNGDAVLTGSVDPCGLERSVFEADGRSVYSAPERYLHRCEVQLLRYRYRYGFRFACHAEDQIHGGQREASGRANESLAC